MFSKTFCLVMTGLTLCWSGCDEKGAAGVGTNESTENASIGQMLDDLQGAKADVEIEVIELKPGSISALLRLPAGQLVPEKSEIIKPLIDGRLQFARPWVVGDMVKEGEVIARLDAEDLNNDIDQQESSIEISKSKIELEKVSLAQKQSSYEKDKELASRGFISQKELEQSDLSVKQSELNLQQAEITLKKDKKQLDKLRRQLDDIDIISPIAGMLVLASHLTGEERKSIIHIENILDLEDKRVSPATAICGVVDPDSYLVRTMVNGKDKSLIELGQSADVVVRSERPIQMTGKVHGISDLQDQKSHAYEVWIKLDGTYKGFSSGLFTTSMVELERRENTIVVPQEYVKDSGGKSVVQLVVKGVVMTVEVETGIRQGGDLIELLSGVKFGDYLIASTRQYRNDQTVIPRIINP